MELKRSRSLTLLMSCLINLCVGATYSWSVFAGPLAERLTALGAGTFTTSDLGIVFTVYNFPGPISMIAGGWLNRRFSVRRLIQAGCALYIAGLLLCSCAKSLAALVGGFGLLVGFGVGTVYGCTVNNTVRLFPDKRGMAGGVTTGIYGISSVLVPPIANALIQRYDVTVTLRGLAAVFAVVLLLASSLVEQGPEEANLPAPGCGREMNWRQMLRRPEFYDMCAMLLCGGLSGMMVVSAASDMAQVTAGFSPRTAALMVSVLALFNAGGRASAGVLSDRLGRIGTLTLEFPVSVAALGTLYLFGGRSGGLFAVCIALVGACFGSLMGIFPGFAADEFGQRNNSVNYGILFIGFGISGLTGPQVASWVMGATGSYQNAFLIAAVVALAGFGLTFVHRRLTGEGTLGVPTGRAAG